MDTVILSSHPIPGNEEMVHRTINRLFQQGAEVIYESVAPVHVSGHASQEEMKMMLQLIKPQHFIPIHGELRHLKQHAAIAREIGIDPDNIAVVENGKIHYESPLEISAVAAELKEYAKSLPGSNYIKEKRKSKEKVGSSIN